MPSYPRENTWDCVNHPCTYVDDGWILTSPLLGDKPLMHLGRVPARDTETLTHYVDKAMYYKFQQSPADWLDAVLFLVGDRNVTGQDNSIMRSYSDSLVTEELSAWPALLMLYAADYESWEWPEGATQDTRDAWNSGCGMVNSFGNTGGYGISAECELVRMARDFCAPGPTFTEELDATWKFPIMFSGSCFVNYFYRRSASNPNDPYCVADDVLLTASDRGAVASFASCHATPAFENYLTNSIFLDLFVSQGVRDLGRLCTATEVEYLRQGVGAEFVAWQYCLLGDPTIQIKVPVSCESDEYWVSWKSGAEIEEHRILQEIYTDDPFFMSHPNLRVVHGGVDETPPCGERMIRAMGRDEHGLGAVEWKLAETEVILERNSVLTFRINIEESPGDAGRVCLDGDLAKNHRLSCCCMDDDIFDQYGNCLATNCRDPLPPGWHLLYADLSLVASDPWEPWDVLRSLLLRYQADMGAGEVGSLLVYVDDIQVRPTNVWRGELLNPDFEEDTDCDARPDFWTNLDGQYGDEVTLWEGLPYSGRYSMRISDLEGTGQGAKQIVHLNEDRQQYWFRFAARANLGIEIQWLVRRVDTGEILYERNSNINRDWARVGCVFDNPWYPGDGVDLVSVEILPGSGQIAYVDSASMVGGLFGEVERETDLVPDRTRLVIAPNPANPTCEIEFHLTVGGEVSLVIYDVSGRVVSQVVSGHLPPGVHRRIWDGRGASGTPVASGIYLCRLTEGDRTVSEKIVVVR